EFVDASPRCFDGTSHRGKVTVEDKHDIVGEPSLGKAGETADIGEQDRDFSFAALLEVDPAPPICGVRKRWQQRGHLDCTPRAELAGEAYIGPGADAAQHARFLLARRIEAAAVPANPHPA